MTEYWINIWQVPGSLAVEAFADGESFGRVLSDQPDPVAAAEGYLAPYGLDLDTSNSSPLLDLDDGVQYRAVES